MKKNIDGLGGPGRERGREGEKQGVREEGKDGEREGVRKQSCLSVQGAKFMLS